MATKYCIIEPSDYAVTLEVVVEPHIVAGGDFQLINAEDNSEIKRWKMSVDFDDPAQKRIHSSPQELHKTILTWQMLCCSKDKDIFEGAIKFSIKQNKKQCKVTEPLKFTRVNIPPCKLKQPDSFNGSLVFIIHKPLKQQ